MLIGVVSDTHNNTNNISKAISVFKNKEVELVIHTGDITNSKSLEMFSGLNCNLIGVYGNNDRNEKGLQETVSENNFLFQEPPHLITIKNKRIAILHEPDGIDDLLSENHDIDLVLHGHTHRYREEKLKGTLIFNPGESAGLIKGKNAIGLIDLNSLNVERIFF